MTKTELAIKAIKKAESLALELNDFGFYLAFSGGKDSQVIYHLAKMAGVKFKSFMSVTTIDPPEVMKFIRNNYPDVVMVRPPINFYKLIVKKHSLPTRVIRYCCQVLKEGGGVGAVVMTGIRKAESNKRSKRNEMEISGYKYSNTLDQFNIDTETKVVCINGKDKVVFNPIINWSDRDVWQFLRQNKIEWCSLYDEGYKRIGCVFCPMASIKSKQKDRLKYPKIEVAIKKSIATLIKENGYCDNLDHNIDEIFNWWISNDSVKAFKRKKTQLKLF